MKRLIYTIFLLAPFIGAYSQQHGHQHGKISEQVKAHKVAFFTEKLELTSEEAEKFWPIYNEYSEKKDEIHSKRRELIHKYRQEKEEISEDDAKKLLNQLIQLQHDDVDVAETYTKKLMDVIPVKKVIKVFIVEEQFKRMLLHRMRDRRKNGDGN